MKNTRKTLTAITLLFVAFSLRLTAQTETRQLVVPLSDPGKPYKLEANLVTGAIHVTQYEGKEVVIDVTFESNKSESETKNGMHHISSGQNVDITARENNNRVIVSSGTPNRTTNLLIKVPRQNGSFKLSTINDGEIIVTNVSGELEVSNVNGKINLSNVSGSVVANTINGDVLVTFKTVDPQAPMAFTTLNGNVDITFPAAMKASLKMKSDRGQIYTDFDFVADKNPAKTEKPAKPGLYQLKIEDWVYGKIGGGGPEILLKNMNGDLFVRKSK